MEVFRYLCITEIPKTTDPWNTASLPVQLWMAIQCAVSLGRRCVKKQNKKLLSPIKGLALLQIKEVNLCSLVSENRD